MTKSQDALAMFGLVGQSGVSANLFHGAENWPCGRCLNTTKPEDIPLVTCTPLVLKKERFD
jgi:hypothetical protein